MSIFGYFCTFSIDPWFRSALKMESEQNFPNQGPICCPKHTHSREEVIVKFLVCDVVVVQVSFFLSFIGCGHNSLLVFNQSFFCRYFAVKRIGFLFSLFSVSE